MSLTMYLTLPDGSREKIPPGICPVHRNGGWCSTNTDADVEGTAAALARAEREARSANERAAYLRGLMGRVLAAQGARLCRCPEPGGCPLCGGSEGGEGEGAR